MSDYTLGIKALDDAIEDIKKGSNIMLIGPPMTGKEVILHRIIYQGAALNKNAVVTVTTRQPAISILEWFKENSLAMPLSRIGIVDCVTKTFGSPEAETEYIKIADSPADLTGIGVKISQFFEDFLVKKNIRKLQLHINSLSTILMYANIQTVFKFMHVFTGRVKTSGALGIYLIESGMHDEQTIATLKQLFDSMIEIKSKNSNNLIRVVGLSSKPTPWFKYKIEGANLRIAGTKYV